MNKVLFSPLVSAIALCMFLPNVHKADKSLPYPVASAHPQAAGPNKARIVWQPETLTLIQQDGGYGRMIRLRNGDLLCAYSRNRDLQTRRSRDNGKTWEEPLTVATDPQAALTNAELIQLRSGAILCLYNARPDAAFGKRENGQTLPRTDLPPRPFAIGLVRSEDGGRTWQPPRTLYEAGREFFNGCWEPAALELPTGEIQIYFANEGPYRNSDEQEISLLRSRDGGKTWSPPETVSFRAGSRDGMPVPLLLQKKKGVAIAIEDNGLSGNFKPVIVFTTQVDNWRTEKVGADSPRRWSALSLPLPPRVYAGAPYLRQMPTGETVLSFQQSETGDLSSARMVVCVGDPSAHNFAEPSYPFPATPGTSQLWNALFVKDAKTLTAISQTTINGVRGLWSIDGHFRHKLPRRNAVPSGKQSGSESEPKLSAAQK